MENDNVDMNIQQKNVDVLDQFNVSQNKNEMLEVLKELFDPTKIELITDLSEDEIRLVTRIKLIADLKDIKSYKDGIDFFMRLCLSKRRASRREIIDAVRGYSLGKSGLMSRMNPFSRDRM